MPNTDFTAHPIADLFPMIAGEELVDLANDIRENGLLEPIVLHEAQILDGRNRYAACEKAGVAPRFVEWKGEGGSPLRFVLSHNLHRRHLTTSQRAAIAAEVLPMFRDEMSKRQGHGQTAPGRNASDHKTQSVHGTALRARDEAAAMMNVGATTVERAKRVKECSPEEFEKIKAGEKTVGAAHRDAGLGDLNQSRKPAPATNTVRDQTRAESHKRRLESALSGVSGTCHGIREIDIERAVTAMTAEEAATWAAIAGDCARTLRGLRKNLNRS